MKNKKQKKGISLIVLVITIIVMIILAAAIILSLQSSGVIGKANEAKTKSDIANKKELINLLVSEYQLALSMGEESVDGKDLRTYIKDELENRGVSSSDVAIAEDGSVSVGLSEIAVKFVEAGVKIGTEVTGYLLNDSEESKKVTTTGTENTCNPTNYTEDVPQVPEEAFERDDNIAWKYFGIDKNGNAIIAGSVTGDTPVIAIGGKGGYVNGPDVLDEMCRKMYSSEMGKARNIKIEDVVSVLEYTGDRAGYYETDDYNFVSLKAVKKIGELLQEKNFSLENTDTPDGKNINDYYANYFEISRRNDVDKYNTDRLKLIYPGTITSNPGLEGKYWISSTAALLYMNSDNEVDFNMYFVSNTYVCGTTCCYSDVNNQPSYGSYAIRPIVELSPKLNMTYDGNIVELYE